MTVEECINEYETELACQEYPYGMWIKENEGAKLFTKKEYDFDLSIDDMIAEWNQMAHEHYANRIDFKPYAREMLELLKEKGISEDALSKINTKVFSI